VTILGNLTVAQTFAGPLLDLPLLRAVGGTFQLSSNAQLTSVSMPLLSSIGGDLLVQSNERLTTLDLFQIVSVGLSLVVTRNAQLEKLSSVSFFPTTFLRLATVGLDLFITENALPCIDFLVLTSVGRDVLVSVGTGTCDTLACLQRRCIVWELIGQLSCACVHPSTPPFAPPPATPPSYPPSVPAWVAAATAAVAMAAVQAPPG